MEAHEGVGQRVVVLPLDLLLPELGGDGVVDVQQGDGVAGHARANVLGQRPVNVHLAGHGDAPGHQPGVHVAGLKAELGRERGPALVGEGHILPAPLVVLRPVQQGQLKLGHPLVQLGIIFPLAHLRRHLGAHAGDAGVARVLLVAHQQIQLGVFLHLHAQLVQALDGGVAGKKVLGPGAEGDDLEVFHADDGPGNGHEVRDHGGDILRRSHRVLGDIGAQMPHPQVVGAVQHPAVGVAPAIDEVAVPLGGGHVHTGAVEVFGNQCLRRLRAEVAQEHHQGVAVLGFYIGHGLQHIQLVLHRHGALVQPARIRRFDGGAAALAQGHGEAVPAHGDEAQLYIRDVFHGAFLLKSGL